MSLRLLPWSSADYWQSNLKKSYKAHKRSPGILKNMLLTPNNVCIVEKIKDMLSFPRYSFLNPHSSCWIIIIFRLKGTIHLAWNRHRLYKSRLLTFLSVGWLDTLYTQRKSFGSMGEFFDRNRSITLIMSCQKGLASTHSYTQCSPRFITLYCTLRWCYH